jgi:hypothetical protein
LPFLFHAIAATMKSLIILSMLLLLLLQHSLPFLSYAIAATTKSLHLSKMWLLLLLQFCPCSYMPLLQPRHPCLSYQDAAADAADLSLHERPLLQP